MKHLKILLVIVLTFMALNTNYAASVVNTTSPTSEVWHTIPKNEVKKEKLHKKDKKQAFKKLLETGDGSGYNIAGFVLGLVGLSLCWVPYLGLALCIGAIVFGGIGLKKKLRGLGIAGLVMGIIGIIPAIIITLLFA